MNSRKILLSLLLTLATVNLHSQNWMMAKLYCSEFVSDILAGSAVDANDISYYQYVSSTYDPLTMEYTIVMVDSSLMDSEDDSLWFDLLDSTDYYATITVGLHGGSAVFNDNITDKWTTNLKDHSNEVFLWNNTGKSIKFGLSCNDVDFYDKPLDVNEYDHYYCTSSDYVYIKIYTLVNGAQTGMVHYKLTPGKGYKVQWDSADAKFEVYNSND
jgi:hypothetical protein